MKSASSQPSPEVNMPAAPKKNTTAPVVKKGPPRTTQDQKDKTRFWLMYPPRLITNPVIWELAQKFKVITNVRQASVNDEIGIVCLELDGPRSEIKSAVKWLEGLGVRVEPVEINVIES